MGFTFKGRREIGEREGHQADLARGTPEIHLRPEEDQASEPTVIDMSKKPKIRYEKPDPLKEPWAKLRKRRGVRILSTARHNP
ncbi:unnamed protein product [marine sediment metagenome]|uniref:Uncharacterized protein n=1 Tax=marine sediment metagenome TaxID=412755 RepID=X0RVH2_9ZZZZ